MKSIEGTIEHEGPGSFSERPASQATRPFYPWFVLAILTCCYMLSIIDRYILSLLIVPIQHELAISDTQVGLMLGIGFGLFFCIMGLPMGWLADRWSRTKLITVGISIWGLATIATGFASNYWQIFLARMGVGFGEAALAPAAWSLITDYFAVSRRGKAISIFQIGGYTGSALGYVVSAFALGMLSAPGTASGTGLPIIGDLAVWRQVVILVGLPTVLVILPVLSIAEPPRRASNVETVGAGQTGLWRELRQHARIYGSFYLAMGLILLMLMTTATWGPTFFVREHKLSVPEAGYLYGAIVILAAAPGVYFGGWFVDWLGRRGIANAYLKTIVGGAALMAPCLAIAVFAQSTAVAAICFGLALFCNGTTNGVAVVFLQSIAPSSLRSRLSALYLLSTNMVGFCGPSLLPIIAREVFTEGLIGVPMAILVMGATTIALALFVLNWRVLTAHERKCRDVLTS